MMVFSHIKLIASDIDGTLLPKGETQFSEENKRQILTWIGKGITFAAVSGRDIPSLKKLFSFAGGKVILVGCDGAVCVRDGKVTYSRPVPDLAVIKALKFSELNKVPLALCAEDRIYVSKWSGEEFISYVKKLYGDETEIVRSTPEIGRPVYKISFWKENGDLGCDLSPFGVRKSYNKNGWSEFVSGIANKGTAVSDLQSRIGAGRMQTVCAGDDESDIPMLMRAGKPFAFNPEIAKRVDDAIYITDFSKIKNHLDI